MRPIILDRERHHPRIRIGRYAEIGDDVELVFLDARATVEIGDCARIGSGVRFVVGGAGARFGDYLTLHERCLVLARGAGVRAGHNVWCHRNVILDGTGGLELGHGVRIGASSQVWTHAEAGEELEGCLLNFAEPTRIGDGAWMVGRVDVNPGAHLAERVVVANGSLVVRPLESAWSLYAGNPARRIPSGDPDRPNGGGFTWGQISLDEKFDRMRAWLREFAAERTGLSVDEDPGALHLVGDARVVVGREPRAASLLDENVTWIDLASKTYVKRLTGLEVELLRWLDGRRARFVPV